MSDAGSAFAPTARPSLWRRWCVDPIVAQLKQGITPERIALTLALASVISVFPILGATTLICALVALRLRLNQPLIQLANYLFYPLQLILLLPFYRAGETLFRRPHLPIFSIGELIVRFKAGPLQFVADYGMTALCGVAVWLLIAPFVAALLYFALRPVLRGLARRVGLRPAG
ncbi:DUF2062 domain-containing protein [Solimonas terrae]|uniref:DUF2062 domain-containing protein n=1 Tax=Solimonas terrae TaxID=1396819 RepID=A0A6M2BSM3_9GAMM|nr:DUF2062 domain-containing protein [Solimonas terrae]NGY05019.1 DUF2062 domain-containing protein [Solimonas terrae]